MMPTIDKRDREKFSSTVRAGRSGRVARHRHHLDRDFLTPAHAIQFREPLKGIPVMRD
jgi:hypothetical protein